MKQWRITVRKADDGFTAQVATKDGDEVRYADFEAKDPEGLRAQLDRFVAELEKEHPTPRKP